MEEMMEEMVAAMLVVVTTAVLVMVSVSREVKELMETLEQLLVV